MMGRTRRVPSGSSAQKYSPSPAAVRRLAWLLEAAQGSAALLLLALGAGGGTAFKLKPAASAACWNTCVGASQGGGSMEVALGWAGTGCRRGGGQSADRS